MSLHNPCGLWIRSCLAFPEYFPAKPCTSLPMQWLDGLRYHVGHCWMNTILGSTPRLDRRIGFIYLIRILPARLFLDPHTVIIVIRYEQHLLLLNTEMLIIAFVCHIMSANLTFLQVYENPKDIQFSIVRHAGASKLLSLIDLHPFICLT